MAKKKTTEQIIREYRNEELRENGDNSVFYTYVMPLEKGNTGIQIYRVMEHCSVGENQSVVRELFYIYEEQPELIAVIDASKYNTDAICLPEGAKLESEEQKEKWGQIAVDIQIGREKAREKIIDTAKEQGIHDRNNFKDKSEIEIDEMVFEKIYKTNKLNHKDKKNKEEDDSSKPPFTLSKETAQRLGIIGFNTLLLNQKVRENRTLKKELGLDNKAQYADVDAIELIPSYKLRMLGEKVPDTPFVAVARHSDGSVEAFPEKICKIYKGENDRVTKTDGNKNEVSTEKADTIIQFMKDEKPTTAIAINQTSLLGRVEGAIAYRTRDNDGWVGNTLQNNKYKGTTEMETEAKEFTDGHKGENYFSKVADTQNEEHPECKNLKIEDLTGDYEYASHLHLDSQIEVDGINATFRSYAMTFGGCGNDEEAINELLINTNKKLGKMKVSQAIKEAIKERNNKIINQTDNPEIVDNVMKRAKFIDDPKKAIELLEKNDWDEEKAVEQADREYRQQMKQP